MVLQMEKTFSDLAYIGNKVEAKEWNSFKFKCEYLDESVVYRLANIQSWNIGRIEPENEF